MIPATEMTEMIDGKSFDRPDLTAHQRFVDFKLWMTFVNRLNRDNLTTQLFPNELKLDDHTTVKPNIFICAEKAPLLIVEADHSEVKLAKYQASAVPEHWVVEQDKNTVTTHILVDGAYVSTVYQSGDAIPIGLDDQLTISVDKLFRIDYSDEKLV